MENLHILKVIYHKDATITRDITSEIVPMYKEGVFSLTEPDSSDEKNMEIAYVDGGVEKTVFIGTSHITNQYVSNYLKALNTVQDDQPLWASYFKNIWCISAFPKESLKNVLGIEKHKNLDIQMFKAVAPEQHNRLFPSIGQQGCSYSHYSVVKMAKENNWDNVMVLEDDVIFHKLFNRYMNAAMEELKEIDWDIFYAHCNNTAYVKFKILKAYETIQQVTSVSYMHCWCFNKRMYDTVIDTFEKVLRRQGCGHINNQIYQLNSATIQVATKLSLTTQIPRSSSLSHNMAVVKGCEKFVK